MLMNISHVHCMHCFDLVCMFPLNMTCINFVYLYLKLKQYTNIVVPSIVQINWSINRKVAASKLRNRLMPLFTSHLLVTQGRSPLSSKQLLESKREGFWHLISCQNNIKTDLACHIYDFMLIICFYAL